MSSLPPIYPLLAHDYSSSLVPHAVVYEHLPPTFPSSSTPIKPKNALVFIGGLGDGPHTVPYAWVVAARFFDALPDWSVLEVRLNSSFGQWGFSSLKRDLKEIGEVVGYLRGLGRERVVLMGHSTGCQDCMEYVVKGSGLPRVDGIILQGPVSDRESTVDLMKKDGRDFTESLAYATRMVEEGRGEDEYMPRRLLPVGYGNTITAYRWHSLVSVRGDDDYFSSDLSEDAVNAFWGSISVKVLVVPSAKDEHVPGHIDVERVLRLWMEACRHRVASELSAMIPGANHRVEQSEGQQWLAERIVRFLMEVVEQKP